MAVLIFRITKKWPGRVADYTASYGAEINAWSHFASPDVRTLVNTGRTVSVSCTRAANVGSCPNVVKPYTMNTFGGVEMGSAAQHILNLRECAALFLRRELSGRAYSRGTVNKLTFMGFIWLPE
jgi:hypothetical protein